MSDLAYVVLVTLHVPAGAEHLQTSAAVEDEFKSWLESLGATALALSVIEEVDEEEECP